jgi:hypothetical protein
MRSQFVVLALACAIGLAAPAPADAHWVRKRDGLDPYAYHFEPRGYYPYYNSNQWVPSAYLRWRKKCCRPAPVLPPYYGVWGYPKPYLVKRRHQHHHW